MVHFFGFEWPFKAVLPYKVVLFTLLCTFFRCKLKSSLVSNIIPRCLWVDHDLTKFSLNYNGGWPILLIFLLKITSWACFLGSGLNIILMKILNVKRPNYFLRISQSSKHEQPNKYWIRLLFFLKFDKFRAHSFSTYAKFSEKLTFLTPRYTHVRVRIRG